MRLKVYQETRATIDATPFEEGSLHIATDTDQIFLDPVGGNERQTLANSGLCVKDGMVHCEFEEEEEVTE